MSVYLVLHASTHVYVSLKPSNTTPPDHHHSKISHVSLRLDSEGKHFEDGSGERFSLKLLERKGTKGRLLINGGIP